MVSLFGFAWIKTVRHPREAQHVLMEYCEDNELILSQPFEKGCKVICETHLQKRSIIEVVDSLELERYCSTIYVISKHTEGVLACLKSVPKKARIRPYRVWTPSINKNTRMQEAKSVDIVCKTWVKTMISTLKHASLYRTLLTTSRRPKLTF